MGPQIPKNFPRPSGAVDFPYIKAFISSIEVIFEGFSISRPQGEKILRFWRHFQGDFDDFSKEKSFQILKIFSSKILKYKGGDIFLGGKYLSYITWSMDVLARLSFSDGRSFLST